MSEWPCQTSVNHCDTIPACTMVSTSKMPRSYTKLKQLGAGSFGTVFLVRDIASGDVRVMKVVSLKGLPLKEVRAARNEVKVLVALQSLNHANLIRYHDSYVTRTDAPRLHIIMEWASGGDLGNLIAQRRKAGKRFSEPEILRMLSEICSALSHCHHRLKLCAHLLGCIPNQRRVAANGASAEWRSRPCALKLPLRLAFPPLPHRRDRCSPLTHLSRLSASPAHCCLTAVTAARLSLTSSPPRCGQCIVTSSLLTSS